MGLNVKPDLTESLQHYEKSLTSGCTNFSLLETVWGFDILKLSHGECSEVGVCTLTTDGRFFFPL